MNFNDFQFHYAFQKAIQDETVNTKFDISFKRLNSLDFRHTYNTEKFEKHDILNLKTFKVE